jgi:cell division protein ZapA
MTQSVVTVRINDQPYQRGCDAGAENHVKTMAEEVNAILQELKQAVGAVGDTRLLAMTSIILADRAFQAEQAAGGATAMASASASADTVRQKDEQARVAQAISAAAEEINHLASRLAKA